MIPELGQFALILALVFAMIQSIASLYGSWRGNVLLLRMSKPLAYGQFVFVGLAFLLLVFCLLTNDFSVLYVAENSNSQLPWFYKICAAWGGHEGSILLWVLILSVWIAAVALFSKNLSIEVTSRVPWSNGL